MTVHRFAVWAAVLPIVLVVTWDAPPLTAPEGAAEPERPLPAVEQPTAAPHVVGRDAWGADEELRTEPVTYTGPARAVFVHHTNHPDDYDCADAPEMLRSMHNDHVSGQGWDDLGYNFVVDKCGTVYEGRGGGVDRYVLGAHTTGFNMDSVGIAALGAFTDPAAVPGELVRAIAEVAAWKLRPGSDPRDRVRMVSTNDDSMVPEGDPAELDVVSGHRDIVQTDCPGDALYAQLPAIREEAARLRVAEAR